MKKLLTVISIFLVAAGTVWARPATIKLFDGAVLTWERESFDGNTQFYTLEATQDADYNTKTPFVQLAISKIPLEDPAYSFRQDVALFEKEYERDKDADTCPNDLCTDGVLYNDTTLTVSHIYRSVNQNGGGNTWIEITRYMPKGYFTVTLYGDVCEDCWLNAFVGDAKTYSGSQWVRWVTDLGSFDPFLLLD